MASITYIEVSESNCYNPLHMQAQQSIWHYILNILNNNLCYFIYNLIYILLLKYEETMIMFAMKLFEKYPK